MTKERADLLLRLSANTGLPCEDCELDDYPICKQVAETMGLVITMQPEGDGISIQAKYPKLNAAKIV